MDGAEYTEIGLFQIFEQISRRRVLCGLDVNRWFDIRLRLRRTQKLSSKPTLEQISNLRALCGLDVNQWSQF